jgi:ppGpp synthetase/RelA/SpoT-type nucleotidyltranferase
MAHDIAREFEHHEAKLRNVAARVEAKMNALLAGSNVPVQFVSARVKSAESLRRKVARPDKTYRSLWDVTDLVGLRVATYFEDAIEDVAHLVEEHFQVDFTHSTDKLRFGDHGRFGYRSVHYVCALDPELAPDESFRFEIQIRTVLQHAWAEVEHDLGYKANDPIPEQIRRRFSRIASLLEIADQEFVSIKTDLAHARDAVRNRVDGNVPTDAISVESLARSELIASLDQRIAGALQKPLTDEAFYPDYLARMLRLAGLRTTEEVCRATELHGEQVLLAVPVYFAYAKSAFGLDVAKLDALKPGYALLFVAHLAIVRAPETGLSKVARLTRMYSELDYPEDEKTAHRIASGLVLALSNV